MTRDTSAYPTLRHYITVYGEQTEKLLRSYVDVESSGARDQIATARIETIEALQVLEHDRRRRTQPGGKRQDVGHYGRLRRHPTVGPHGWIRRRRTFACAFLGC